MKLSKTEEKALEKVTIERYKSLVVFAKKFANNTFSNSKNTLNEIVEFKRMARLALRGEVA